jgi:3-methylcrotonyl-CoA carboxylase beta subunit
LAVIKSLVNTSSPEFRRRYGIAKALVEELRRKQHEARHARPQRDLDRLRKQGKLTPRERLARLLDPGTPFLELSTLAANRA